METKTEAKAPSCSTNRVGAIDVMNWYDWRWQQQHSITSVNQLLEYFPGLDEESVNNIALNSDARKLSLTPYVLSLICRDESGLRPRNDDPIWRQLVPNWDPTVRISNDYDGSQENWELPEEMKTPICQHKYPNRVILRVANVCHSYCQFCYEALRTLEKHSEKEALKKSSWQQTVDYIAANDEIEEVILSGGEPLMLSDERLDAILASLRAIDRNIAIRLHTRTLTFNPFRITDQLVAVLEKHQVNAIGLHITHAAEITDEFKQSIRKLRKASPIMFGNIPLLAGVNADYESIQRLCMTLYRAGVIPHYLYHFMPFSPGLASYRTDVRTGQEIIKKMKRRVTNLAVPEYVLPHATGKYTLPLDLDASSLPAFKLDDNGSDVVEFTSWKGERVHYSNVC